MLLLHCYTVIVVIFRCYTVAMYDVAAYNMGRSAANSKGNFKEYQSAGRVATLGDRRSGIAL